MKRISPLGWDNLSSLTLMSLLRETNATDRFTMINLWPNRLLFTYRIFVPLHIGVTVQVSCRTARVDLMIRHLGKHAEL